MLLIKIILIAMVAVIATILLKEIKPEMAIFISISAGIVILFLLLDNLTNVFASIKNLVSKTNLNSDLFKCVMKVVGMGYITEFGSNICIDAGNTSIADKIIFAGKICILILCMPVINNLIEMIVEIMP